MHNADSGLKATPLTCIASRTPQIPDAKYNLTARGKMNDYGFKAFTESDYPTLRAPRPADPFVLHFDSNLSSTDNTVIENNFYTRVLIPRITYANLISIF